MTTMIRGDEAASAHVGDGRAAQAAVSREAGQSLDCPLQIALLTGGDDRPYALGMASALKAQGIRTDFIASDKLDAPELHDSPFVEFLNLRGDQREDVSAPRKVVRILRYYARLMWYAATAKPRVFHILWNNKFETFDRTLLMLYYRALGNRVVLTAHNVNAARRDGRDTWLNQASLRLQYSLCCHILVHTHLAKAELASEFGINETKVTVIPFGINDTIPKTTLSSALARADLGLGVDDRVLLFFGQIAPYKGLEFLLEALGRPELVARNVKLIVAGKVKRGHEQYWKGIEAAISSGQARERIIARIGFIPDDQVERYFKATDAVVLPYTAIFQSGVPFLAYGFGVPVVATDVGALREDIIEEQTGYVCPPRDPAALADAIVKYFEGDLYHQRHARRADIRAYAVERHSWDNVGRILRQVYEAAARA
jgi:glycosyltransferase involved in cell wall biosynthesis